MKYLFVGMLLTALGPLAGMEVARAQSPTPPGEPLVQRAGDGGGMAMPSPWLLSGWDDGLAEVAEYDLQQFRYGQLHPGSAVLVCVRENMDAARSVKVSSTANVSAITIPVLKAHWVRSFQTGSYRYDQSSFQLVSRADGLLQRWFITSHEWCGSAGKSWIPGHPLRVSSYFDGHGDVAQTLDLGNDTVAADSLWWWCRAWVAAGAHPAAVQIVPSQIDARCIDTTSSKATVHGIDKPISHPLHGKGTIVPGISVTIERGAAIDHLLIGKHAPHTLYAWQQADSSQLHLRALRRFDYWAHHDAADRPPAP